MPSYSTRSMQAGQYQDPKDDSREKRLCSKSLPASDLES